MKIIIKVNKKSSFASLNGHTFEVNEILNANGSKPIFAIGLPTGTTDFSINEIIIVDMFSEFTKADQRIQKIIADYADLNGYRIYC